MRVRIESNIFPATRASDREARKIKTLPLLLAERATDRATERERKTQRYGRATERAQRSPPDKTAKTPSASLVGDRVSAQEVGLGAGRGIRNPRGGWRLSFSAARREPSERRAQRRRACAPAPEAQRLPQRHRADNRRTHSPRALLHAAHL